MTVGRASRRASATGSDIRRQAGELSRDGQGVTGPLNGYHHETYAFPLPATNALSARFERAKLRAPRPGLLWFDRRCFASEDLLLTALQGRVVRIPEIIRVDDGVYLQGFIEGRTLDARQVPGHQVSGRGLSRRHAGQLREFFRQLVSIDPKELAEHRVTRICAPDDRTAEGDSAAFLDRLIRFTEEQVHLGHGEPYRTLFAELGVGADALGRLRKRTVELRSRPFALLHCDLHRKNLIVDRGGDLWVIDWELAMIGDPLYDLATHLHLMGYPRQEEARVKELWVAAVEEARAGSSYGWEEDLPLLLAYKRVQSVFTDIIRTALLLGPDAESNWRVLPRVAWRIQRVLAAAERELYGADAAPTVRQVMTAYRNWFRTTREPDEDAATTSAP
ncbi:phosphotransferase [Streptomyces sp. NPDC088124]|uniref:phosphotransferase n=1 Tax=Streptomyces sp. NPDC088124 TaxID=3154654 RepID=UPI003432BD2F